MKRIQRTLFLGTVSLLVVLSLLTGCYRPAAPDVTETPGGDAEAVVSEDEILATAAAEATRAAQPEGEEPPTTEPPTAEPPAEPSPTQTQAPQATTTHTPVPPTAVPTEPAPTQTPSPSGGVTHVVQRGENLFRIALRYGTTVQAIASANGIANPALISTGRVLTIPSPGAEPLPPPTGETTYTVQPGDNLFRIALRYNISYLHLAQYNNIANPSHIQVGRVLRIPPH
ncbi:MAG: LysM peptidoglycan-binding domain-containing protein [Chloroflexota bacterium]|nr:LysM peptidoglycan-binding domain-containing protein [Chloroflexota bacterium]